MNLLSPGVRRLACCGVAAVAAGGAFLLMSGDGGAQSTTAPSGPTQPAPRFLEFDMPGEASAITAFIVGYFVPGEKVPAFAFEVPRSGVEPTTPGSVRIPVIVGSLPAGQTYIIRLRTVAGGRQSAWSAPSGSFTVPPNAGSSLGKPVAATADRPGDERARRERPARSAVSALERDPELKKRLAKEFPDVDLVKAATGFRTVPDLATALFAASNLKVPFAEIKKLTAEAGNRNFQKAIAKLKPGADARAEARRARNQARQTLGDPRNVRR